MVVSATIAGAGTAESAWAPWLAAQSWPQLALPPLPTEGSSCWPRILTMKSSASRA